MGIVISAFRRRVAWAAATAVVLSGALASLPAAPAAADAALPQTVSADPLPTVQIDGVVWKQLIVGSTVFVGGKFANARPAGSPAGTNQTPRNNMLAYDLTTGALITSFAPSFNAQVKDIAVSADGTTLYVAGSFTTVNGVTRNRLAALDVATGALKSWAPSANSYATSVAVNGSVVYVGGVFTAINGQSRPRLAAVDATTGALTPFTVPVDDNQVNAITVSPDGSALVIAGNFTTVGGSSDPGYGLARLDAATGAMLPLPLNSEVRDAGPNSAIDDLASNGTYFYGTGWHYGSGGNSEGAFAASWATGELFWLEDCHGDSYGVVPIGNVVYVASHHHYCGNSGGFPQTTPWTYHHGTATTNDVRGVNTADIYGYPDHPGTPRPEFLEWYPQFTPGTYTGADQGPWTVTGNSDYVLYGGEFLAINGTPQQGLVRFANRSIAPNKVGPANKGPYFTLSTASFVSGQVRLSWPGNPDEDDATVQYALYRGSTTTPPIYTQTVTAPFWQQPQMTFTDQGLTPGTSQRYRVIATDPWGNTAMSDWMTVTVSADSLSSYAQQILNDKPTSFWRLGEPSGPTGFDWAGGADLTLAAGVTRGTAGAVNGDANTATTFGGTSTGTSSTSTAIDGPSTFSLEAWFNTTSTTGGKIVGFGSGSTTVSSSYDRHVYMTNAGNIVFGVYPGSVKTLTSSASYNDGKWHHVVASLGSGGMQLYVDGLRVGQRGDVTTAQAYQGYWRVGGDNLNGWPSQPTSAYFAGAIDEVAVYPNVLSADTIRSHYIASGRTLNVPAAPADAYGQAVYNADPDLYWRFDESSGSVVHDSGPEVHNGGLTGAYSWTTGGALFGVSTNRSITFGPKAGNAYTIDQFASPNGYTLESWFKTTSTSGGKIIGFGSSQTGLSSNYDRHVYMQDNGQLVFGVWTGQANTITSALSYNDGNWHHVMATQDPSAGMRLYVDGQIIGANPQTGAQDYAGYWRVGGDSTWSSSSAYLAGSFDEVAVYPRALTSNDALLHYGLGTTGSAPNLPPMAQETLQLTGRTLSADGTGSTDSDGTITAYAWDFGDGSTATTATATHTYAAPGTYTVTLTVTDDSGATGSTQQSVTVVDAPPTAAFSVSSARYLSVGLDGSASSDSDGTITGYRWDFGDGSTASGSATATHDYTAGGTYTVTLTVTDNDGVSTSVSHDVTVAVNQPPTASFTPSASGLTVTADGTGSTDPDGVITSYAWTFGDGATATAPTVSHTYATGGTYPVTLTVTDDGGLTGTTTTSVTVAPDQPPVAAFTTAVSSLSLSVDGTGSSDPDGSVVSYAWSFGDGATATNATAQHTYAAAGTYPVTLTVTDNLGTTGSTTQQVTVTAPATYAADSFGRTVTGGWGSADTGGAWTLFGSASQYSVGNGSGVMALGAAGATARTQLRSVSAGDVDQTVQFSLDKLGNGGGTYVSLTSRDNGWNTMYRSKVWVKSTGVVVLSLTSLATTETTLAQSTVSGVTLTPGVVLHVRFQTQGVSPTTLRARVWLDGTAEPTVWQLTATDSTAGLQTAGAVGIDTSLSGSATNAPVALSFDGYGAGTIGSPLPANQPPVASFTATVNGLSVAVDGSASSDPDGTVTGYAWTFGTATATGATASYTFPAAGTYPVTLTVTDDKGATGTLTKQVTVASTTDQPPVASFTTTVNGLSVAVDGTASSDADGTIASYAWDFAGASATGPTVSYTFAAAGTYNVTLTVTDDKGLTGTLTKQVTVTAPVNQPPVASFVATTNGLTVSVDGTSSSDSDGTIASYAWDFAGAAATGPTASYTFAAAGTYAVTLTVTDDKGATATATQQVTVTAAVALASDTFARTVTGGWGTADIGGLWTLYGSSSLYSVAPGIGSLRLATAGGLARTQLQSLSLSDVDISTTFSLEKIADGGGTYVSLTGRTSGWSSLYRGKVWVKSTGAVNVSLSRVQSGETTFAQTNLTIPAIVAGARLDARLQIVGANPTTLRIRVWPDGTSEPTTWQLTGTDSTPELQDAGGVGIDANLSGSSTAAPFAVQVAAFRVVAPAP